MASKTRMLSLVKAFRWREVEVGLRENPALIEFRDPQGRNWLHLCCSVNLRKRDAEPVESMRTAEVLLEAGIDINEPAFTEGAWKATPLWHAIARGENLPLAKYLLERGSDPDHCLWAAVNRDSPAAIRLLLAYGAEDPTDGEASLLLAAIQWNRFAAAEELLQLGADVDFQDAKGMTALHYLLDKGSHKRFIRMLTGHGARGDLEDGRGRTAVEIMLRKRDPELRILAAELLARSARTNRVGSGITLLQRRPGG